jgi:RNA polymerase sporulation-specific sigma factor
MIKANVNPESFTDEELVALAQAGDKLALEEILSRYKNLVYAKAKAFFLAGADEDDIIQEGFIGLYNAVKDFKGDTYPYFKAFAGICVSRRIITAVKAATRQKHMPLNSYVSLDDSTYDAGGDKKLPELVAEFQDPETILIDRENVDGIEYKINKALSKLELEVLIYYLRGMSYQEIAKLLGKDVKSVDNAIQRIRKKLENILND